MTDTNKRLQSEVKRLRADRDYWLEAWGAQLRYHEDCKKLLEQAEAEVERLRAAENRLVDAATTMRDVICHIAMTDPTGYCAVFGKACGLCAYARNVLGPKYRMPGDELKETKT